MNTPPTSLPFAISNIYQGFAIARGVATIDPRGLRLSFEIVDEIFGWLKSDVTEVMIPWADLAQVKYKQGWFGDRIQIIANTLAVVQPIPRRQGARFTLEVNRRQRADAQHFELMLRSAIGEAQMQQLEAGVDETRSMPNGN